MTGNLLRLFYLPEAPPVGKHPLRPHPVGHPAGGVEPGRST